MRHLTCKASGCADHTPAALPLCRHHWDMVPRHLRQKLRAAEDAATGDFTDDRVYMAALHGCIAWCAHIEGRTGQFAYHDGMRRLYEAVMVGEPE